MAEQWRRMPLDATFQHYVDIGVLPPNGRMWDKTVEDGQLRVIRTVELQRVAAGEERWITHLSISHSDLETGLPGRYPTWDEQKEAVYRFAPGKAMCSYLPPEGSPYVNEHETTFHWWETEMWQ